MAISAPANPREQLRSEVARLIVLLGDEVGGRPTLDDEVDYLIPMRIGVYANGGRDDVMTFRVDMKRLAGRLVDTTIPIGHNRQIEVRMLDEDGDATIVLGWGFIARQPQVIDDGSEYVSIEVRLDQHVFGTPLVDYPIKHPLPLTISGAEDESDETTYIIHQSRKVIFNPEIDEIIEPNKSSAVRTMGDSNFDSTDKEPWHYFADPEAHRTSAASEFKNQALSLWTLAEAVHFLCWWMNPNETYIQNPHLDELEDVFIDRNNLVKNVEIPFGSFLPAALDNLLIQAEYGWHLINTINDDNQRETRIRFYSRGVGATKQIFMQRPGVAKTLEGTNVDEFNATYSLVDLANRVEVYGANFKREGTFMLRPGWDEADDDIDLADLETGQPTATEKPNVGRKWILNEAGDYIGRRTDTAVPYDFDELTPPNCPQSYRRRKFEPCLSQKADGDDKESFRYVVEWYDADAEGAVSLARNDPGWTKVKWPFSILEKECGIYFEGPTPPDALWSLINAYPLTTYVRITACVVLDQRIRGIAARRDQSPNGLDITLVLDMKNKFQWSDIATTSKFFLQDPEIPNSARDDTDKIQQYAEDVRNIEDAAQVSCSVTLEGIEHHEYELGDLVDRVDGRNLSLDGYTPRAPAEGEPTVRPRRPQIVGFNYILNGGQRLEVLLESFKQERPELTTIKKK